MYGHRLTNHTARGLFTDSVVAASFSFTSSLPVERKFTWLKEGTIEAMRGSVFVAVINVELFQLADFVGEEADG